MSGCLSGSVYLTVFLAVSRSLSGSDSGPLCLVASVLWRPHNPYKLGGLNLIYWQLGAVHKLCQRPKGEEGVCKMLTMADKGGRGGKANADIG